MSKGFTLRLDDELRAEVEVLAEKGERSLNRQIVWMLREHLKAEAPTGVINNAVVMRTPRRPHESDAQYQLRVSRIVEAMKASL